MVDSEEETEGFALASYVRRRQVQSTNYHVFNLSVTCVDS